MFTTTAFISKMLATALPLNEIILIIKGDLVVIFWLSLSGFWGFGVLGFGVFL